MTAPGRASVQAQDLICRGKFGPDPRRVPACPVNRGFGIAPRSPGALALGVGFLALSLPTTNRLKALLHLLSNKRPPLLELGHFLSAALLVAAVKLRQLGFERGHALRAAGIESGGYVLTFQRRQQLAAPLHPRAETGEYPCGRLLAQLDLLGDSASPEIASRERLALCGTRAQGPLGLGTPLGNRGEPPFDPCRFLARRKRLLLGVGQYRSSRSLDFARQFPCRLVELAL